MTRIAGINTLNPLDSKMMRKMMGKGEKDTEGLTASAEVIHAKAVAPTAKQPTAPSVMGNSFVKSGDVADHQSKYVKARQVGMQAVKAEESRQDAILSAGIASNTGSSYAARTLAGKKAARKMMEDMQRTAMESSQSNLDDMKKRIEEKSKEAAESKATDASTTKEQTTTGTMNATENTTVTLEVAAAPETTTSEALSEAPPTITSVDMVV